MSPSLEDIAFIENQSLASIQEYRAHIFTEVYRRENAAEFLDNKWIDAGKLRQFLATRASRVTVKEEPSSSGFITESFPIKQEPIEGSRLQSETTGPRIIIHNVGNREVHEILDSDDEANFPADHRRCSPSVVSLNGEEQPGSSLCTEAVPWEPSDTFWPGETKSEVHPMVSADSPLRVTRQSVVQRLERLTEIPAVWPVLDTPTAFILDLSDPKHRLYEMDKGDLRTPDFLIKHHDNDSWSSSSGRDGGVLATFEPDTDPVTCFRARLLCKGAYRCTYLSEDLIGIERRGVEPAHQQRIAALQAAMRQADGSTAQSRAAIHAAVVSKPCSAVDPVSNDQCLGVAKIREYTDEHGVPHHFIGCSGWRPNFKIGHRKATIPPEVDVDLLQKCLKRLRLSEGNNMDSPSCGTIICARVGKKQEACPFAHIVDGEHVAALMVQMKCQARMTIFVPHDQTIKKAIIVFPYNDAHSHPVLPLRKATQDVKQLFSKAVNKHGLLGATVTKVDTSVIVKHELGGKSPADFHPAFSSSRLKRDLIKAEQYKSYPAGLGLTGAYHLFQSDKNVSPDKRYVHMFFDDDGHVFILTCLKGLLELVHEVVYFECDTTFTRVREFVVRKATNKQEELVINEWEMVVFYKPIQRALTIMRIYTNRYDRASYEKLFDAVQKITFELTGRPLAFKRLRPQGNLLAMVVDMEIAQVQGAAASFAKTQDASYSKLGGIRPEAFPPYIIKLCHVHSKRGLLDFQHKLSKKDYHHILTYMDHIKTKEDLETFHSFVLSFKIPKLTAWWMHKRSIEWIPLCIIGGLSPMGPDWDATPRNTNAGEGQHAWTKARTGRHLTIVQAVDTGREVDTSALKEVVMARESGLPANKQNELVHRQTRNVGRRDNRVNKGKMVEKRQNMAVKLQKELSSAQGELHLAKAKRDNLKQQLKETKSAATSSGAVRKVRMTKMMQEESSSSGRVKNQKMKKRQKTDKFEIGPDDDDFDLPLLSDLFRERQSSTDDVLDFTTDKSDTEDVAELCNSSLTPSMASGSHPLVEEEDEADGVQDSPPPLQQEEAAYFTDFDVPGLINLASSNPASLLHGLPPPPSSPSQPLPPTAPSDDIMAVDSTALQPKRKERDPPDTSKIIDGSAKRSRKPTSKAVEAETNAPASASIRKPVSLRRKPASKRA